MVLNETAMERINFQSILLKLIILFFSSIFYSPLNAQTTHDGSTAQFLFPDFSLGKVRMKNGNIQSTMLNYNMVSEKMVFEKGGNLYDMVNIEMIDTVFVQESKFVPVGKVFYEVLLIAPISLFIQHKGELLPPGAPAGYGGTSQVSNSKNLTSVNLSMGYYNLKLPQDYTVKVDLIYWIRKDNIMFSYTNERQFIKIFPERVKEIKEFIKKQKIKFDMLKDQIRLTEHCNEMIR